MVIMSGETAPLAARRIMVYGVTGSGKTTTAARLAGRTGLPWYAIDDLTWDAGWTSVPVDEQRRRIGDLCARDAWIIDSGYSHWLDLPMARADLIVALDFPRWLSFGRLLRRSLVNVIAQRPTCNGNVETWHHTFASEESILRWHLSSFSRKHRRMLAWMAQPDVPRVIRFTRPSELTSWLGSLTPITADPPPASLSSR